MQPCSRFLLAACAAAALAAAGCGGEAPAAPERTDGPLVLVTTGQTPPYSYRDEATGEIVGTEIEIARAAAGKLGRALEVRVARFPELLPMVGSGEADIAASGITITEGRRQTVDFSVPFATEGGMFLYRAGETAPSVFRAERLRVATIDASTYDFYLTGPDRLAFLVADVSDKGVPAALFMMRAKTLLKNLAQTGRPLDEAVAAANEALCEGNAANMFVTAWVGEIDLASGTVRYVNAGHNPPVVLRAQDGSADYLRSRPGLVLGAMPGAKYRTGEISLGPGDALYLYTDGLTEQTNPNGELFGEARLELLLAGGGFLAHPEACTGAVLAGVEAHAAGAEQSDDRTQLLLRWRGPAA